MFKKLFNIYYDKALISLFAIGAKQGAVVSNFLAPLIVISTMSGYIPTLNLTVWFSLHVIIFFVKMLIGRKLHEKLKMASEINSYLIPQIILTSLSSLLYGAIAWGAIIYNVPEINIFILIIIIVALTAGSFATLGSVYIAYLSYLFFSIVPTIGALLYYNEPFFDLLALILLLYLVFMSVAGYRYFIFYQNNVKLENKFKTIFNKSSDGICIIEGTNNLECNETILNMFGYAGEMELFLQTPLAILSPKYQPDNQLSKRKMLIMLNKGRKETISFDWLHTKKDASEFWTEVTLTPMHIDGRTIVHGIWVDITDKKKYAQDLKILNETLELRVKEELEKNMLQDQQMLQQSRLAQMGEMISMIAHQWRQPLNAISLTSNNLMLKCILDDINKDFFEKELKLIDNYSQHLSHTIDDFRNFFKEDKELELTSVDDIIEGTLEIVQISLENRNIKIVKELDCDKKILTYPNGIKQVLLNLIKNAEDALAQNETTNPTISISSSCKSEDDFTTIFVTDNAGGIPEDIIDKIFDPYFSTKKEKDGTGIGLYMSKTIIEDHCAGKLSVANILGGAKFKIILGQLT